MTGVIAMTLKCKFDSFFNYLDISKEKPYSYLELPNYIQTLGEHIAEIESTGF